MQTSVLTKIAAFSGVCLGFIAGAGVAQAGPADVAVVSVNTSGTYMTGTTYGTSLSADADVYIECEVQGDAWPLPYSEAYCRGSDSQGDFFQCYTDDPVLVRAVQTMPNYGRISVWASDAWGSCTNIYSYRGSRYLPPGASGGGHPEMSVSSGNASGSFYGARVSADTIQYANCTLYDTPTFSSVTCQAKDVAGDYFYCSSTDPLLLAPARNLKDYSQVYFYRSVESTDCVVIYALNGSDTLP